MAIKESEIIINLAANNLRHLESLGYRIPRKVNQRKELVAVMGERIKVLVKDLPPFSNSKITRICDKCGKEELVTYATVIRSRIVVGSDHCKSCSLVLINNNIRKNLPKEKTVACAFPDIAEDWNYEKNGDTSPHDFSYGSGKYIWWNCRNDRSHIYRMKIHKRTIDNQGCVTCANLNKSKGEKKIYTYLEKNNISFSQQYTFEGCKGLRGWALRFDFAIFDVNGKLQCLIEYDGKQHFEPVCFGNMTYEEAEKNFMAVKENDKIKDVYCDENNLTLLRISYKDESRIEKILSVIKA